jgi:hypothetical protein
VCGAAHEARSGETGVARSYGADGRQYLCRAKSRYGSVDGGDGLMRRIGQRPSRATLRDDDWGRTLRYGRGLITKTYALIGPELADASHRYSGNNQALRELPSRCRYQLCLRLKPAAPLTCSRDPRVARADRAESRGRTVRDKHGTHPADPPRAMKTATGRGSAGSHETNEQCLDWVRGPLGG